jgi:hypothetical protein
VGLSARGVPFKRGRLKTSDGSNDLRTKFYKGLLQRFPQLHFGQAMTAFTELSDGGENEGISLGAFTNYCVNELQLFSEIEELSAASAGQLNNGV